MFVLRLFTNFALQKSITMKNIIISLAFLCLLTTRAFATIIYVDSSNAGGFQDGHSWATAFSSLQTGINNADAGDSVWVAKATYQPSVGVSFNMKEGVKVFGGFLNTYTSFAQRDWQNIVTILKGNNAAVIVNSSSLNITPDALLDGFLITKGKSASGGGMINTGASPSVKNCTFSSNSTTVGTSNGGGGMCNLSSSSPVLTNCTFTNDTTYTGKGGGMYNDYSSPILINCSFIDNVATNSMAQGGFGEIAGGAIYNNYSSSTITGCTFSGNRIFLSSGAAGYGYGGAIYGLYSPLIITNCTFTNNSAKGAGYTSGSNIINGSANGAAIYFLVSSPVITGCIFSHNQCISNTYVSGRGGAINFSSSSPKLISCTFNNNTASEAGGSVFINDDDNIYDTASPIIDGCFFSGSKSKLGAGLYLSDASLIVKNSTFTADTANKGGALYINTNSPRIVNCLFYKNLADSFGGAIYCQQASPHLVNNTIVNNRAATGGSGLYNMNSTSTITNSIVWANSSGVQNDGSSLTKASYSLIQGYVANAIAHNLDGNTDPLFIDTSANNYHLQTNSPCINKGNNDSIPSDVTTDLDGYNRIYNDTVDLGAYEFGNTPLKLHLLNFKGISQSDGTALLQWQIETDKSAFINLQRSDDGRNFSTVYSVTAPGSAVYAYSYTDKMRSVNYYRLKIIDEDGSVSYSRIVLLKQNGVHIPTKAYPNPAKESINIIIGNESLLGTLITITDISGKIISKRMIDSNVQNISLQGLQFGLYVLRMENGEVLKIRKQ